MDEIILASWLAFAVYWVITASNVKKDAEPKIWWHGRFFSLARLTLVIMLAFLYPSIVKRIIDTSFLSPRDTITRVIGVVLTISGVLLSIWARSHLGKNWSSHPAVKENHELITSGPYRLLRHPIYAGMLAALLGSLLCSSNPFWFYFLIVMGVTIVYRVPVEEEIMMRTFPETYPAYKKSTSALIPFIW